MRPPGPKVTHISLLPAALAAGGKNAADGERQPAAWPARTGAGARRSAATQRSKAAQGSAPRWAAQAGTPGRETLPLNKLLQRLKDPFAPTARAKDMPSGVRGRPAQPAVAELWGPMLVGERVKLVALPLIAAMEARGFAVPAHFKYATDKLYTDKSGTNADIDANPRLFRHVVAEVMETYLLASAGAKAHLWRPPLDALRRAHPLGLADVETLRQSRLDPYFQQAILARLATATPSIL